LLCWLFAPVSIGASNPHLREGLCCRTAWLLVRSLSIGRFPTPEKGGVRARKASCRLKAPGNTGLSQAQVFGALLHALSLPAYDCPMASNLLDPMN
jgi:hypothetical protein